MTSYLALPSDRMHEVPLGVNPQGYGERRAPPGAPFVIGYLARICPEKGLHVLVQAVKLLAEAMGAGRLRLSIAGWLGPRDRAYFDGIMEQIRAWRLEEIVDYRGEIDHAEKIAFLSSIHVLSVPTTYEEPKGRFVLEALASGVPVVQPRHGAFPEIIEATGGGLLVEPDSPQAVAAGLRALMTDPARRAELGRRGREAVRRHYSDEAMARRTLEVYQRYLRSDARPRPDRSAR
jgi:glycosyltransferase involved in cell wall biosynthesis